MQNRMSAGGERSEAFCWVSIDYSPSRFYDDSFKCCEALGEARFFSPSRANIHVRKHKEAECNLINKHKTQPAGACS